MSSSINGWFTPLPAGTPIPKTGNISGEVPNTATAETTHQMFVAIAILLAFGMLLILIAGESEEAGNAIIAFLGIIVFVQLVTKVNPFVQWIAKHPLTPMPS